MQFLVLMIPGVYHNNQAKPDFKPDDAEKMLSMGRFNDELAKSVKLVSLNGLKPLTSGARLTFSKGKPTVTDGPFVEAKEVLGGFWMLEADSKEQLVELFKRCPADEGDTIEIRQVFDVSDFPIKVQEALQAGRKS